MSDQPAADDRNDDALLEALFAVPAAPVPEGGESFDLHTGLRRFGAWLAEQAAPAADPTIGQREEESQTPAAGCPATAETRRANTDMRSPAAKTDEAKLPHAQQETGRHGGPRVVLADDEALIRLDLKEILQEAGYEVVAEASDGAAAVRLAEECQPDLCIFDVYMPVLDGIKAAELVIKARIAPVLILTAFSQRELVERAAEAGVMNYLVKPFTKDKLISAIEIAVSRHQQMKTLEEEVADLNGRLETRKLVDRAKGLLQTAHGMTEPEAFRWIQKTSMDRRLTMREAAEVVLSNPLPPSS